MSWKDEPSNKRCRFCGMGGLRMSNLVVHERACERKTHAQREAARDARLRRQLAGWD